MNIYVVTEGVVELKVYKHWIPLVNPSLSPVERIEDIQGSNYFLISGGGYPQYYDVIENAIYDVNHHTDFDRLVISIDSEDMSHADKYQEMDKFISKIQCRVDTRIVIQHFCFETWGLGNRIIIRPNTQSIKLRRYRGVYDVRSHDPELLPPYPDEELNRSQFAEKYLRSALNDRFRNLTYTKRNPRALLHNSYFDQVMNRLHDTGHIPSFDGFLSAFI